MEELSPEYEDRMKASATDVIEIFDIFLTDGTHMRFNSSSYNMQFVDFEE